MAQTTQYATVTIPANHPCERTITREVRRWPIPLTVRAHRAVTTNKNKGTFRPEGPWIFIYGAYAYSFEPWPGFVPGNERFGQKDFVLREGA